MADVKKLIEMFEAKAKAKPSAKVVNVPPLEKSGPGTALAPDVRKAVMRQGHEDQRGQSLPASLHAADAIHPQSQRVFASMKYRPHGHSA